MSSECGRSGAPPLRTRAPTIHAAAPELGWYDEPGKANVLRILGRGGTLPVTVRLLDPLDRSGDRKQLTGQARESIARSLGLTSPAHSPIATGE